MKHIAGYLFTIALFGCGGKSDGEEPSKAVEQNKAITQDVSTNSDQAMLEIPINQNLATYKVALIGNSHTYGVTNTLKQVVAAYSPQSVIELKVLGSGYTDDLIKNEKIIDELKTGNWSHLIIQGQKYSQSGSYNYSTEATENFISLSKSLDIMPILFPEHPQKGNKAEGEMVYNLHSKISKRESSCVAPIGLAWNKATEQLGENLFYSSDGNHAGPYGFMTTSLILTEIITGEVVDTDLARISEAVPNDIQSQLAQIASQTLSEFPPCK